MLDDSAHLWSVFGFDGLGIVPEVQAVDIFVVEPQAGVVRVVDAFAGALLKRKAACDDGAFGRAERIEDRFF